MQWPEAKMPSFSYEYLNGKGSERILTTIDSSDEY
jgi:hypothetical protein